MRMIAIWLLGLLGILSAAGNAELSQIQAVYILPMSSGFDQYLANRLTNAGLLRVVTDSKKADAVFTDNLGAAFESRLDELYPQPEPQKAKPGEKPAAGETSAESTEAIGAKTGSEKEYRPQFSGSRSKGTLFLVDARDRRVLWSVFDRPKNSSPGQLDKTAGRMVERLKKEITGK